MSPIIDAWKKFVKTHERDFIGGDFQYIPEGRGVFRGPIKKIRVKGKDLVVTTEWTAHLPRDRRHGWAKIEGRRANVFRFDISVGPEPMLDQYGFQWGGPGYALSFLKRGAPNPDGFGPSKVMGL